MNYTLRMCRTFSEIVLNDWEEVRKSTQKAVFMDVNFLKCIELSMSTNSMFYYVQIYDPAGKPVAGAALSTFSIDMLASGDAKPGPVASVIRKVFPGFLKPLLLICGLPISIGDNFLVIRPEADQKKILALLDKTMNELAGEIGAEMIMFLDTYQNAFGGPDYLSELEYKKRPTDHMYSFLPQFSDFPDYLKGLKSKYRGNIKRSETTFSQAGYTITHYFKKEEQLALYDQHCYSLYKQVVGNSDQQFEILPYEFFIELIKNNEGKITLTVAEKDGVAGGYIFSIKSPERFVFLFIGMDYSIKSEISLYNNLIYNVLDLALKEKPEVIQVGQTANTFKARLGCYPEPINLYVKYRTVHTKLMGLLLDEEIFSPVSAPEVYNVYKKGIPTFPGENAPEV